ncbi:MAG: DUF2062 domain-containing protein [Candidatus Brocadiia bacterium]
MLHKRWLRKQRQIARALKDSLAHRWLGDHLFNKALWIPHRTAAANGLALGLFIAFTPTIPFQMALAAGGAVLLKVNLPAAIVGVWVTNPLTAVPIYLSANRLGYRILQDAWLPNLVHEFFVQESRSATFFTHSLYLWTGSLVMAMLAASLGWGAVYLLWSLME